MDIDSSPRTRKRARPLHQQLNSSSPTAGTTPLSAVKRRKLDISGASPSTPKALQALKTAIGGVFNFGKIKEIANGTEALETDSQASKDTDGATAVFDEFIDELLAEESQDQGINGDNYDSEPYMAERRKVSENGDDSPQNSRPRREGKGSRTSLNAADTGVAEDVDELSDDENHHKGINGSQNHKKDRPRQRKVSMQEDNVTPGPKSGRKRKRSQMPVTTTVDEPAEDELGVVAEALGNSNGRRAGARVGAGPAESFTKQNLKWRTRPATKSMASTDNSEDAREASVGDEGLSGSGSRPSRKRRRPRRYSNEMIGDMKPKLQADTTLSKTLDSRSISISRKKLESSIISTQGKDLVRRSVSTPTKKQESKSILTPSKKPQERLRKSVTFGMDSPIPDDQALDLQESPVRDGTVETSTSVKKKRGRPRRTTDIELPLIDTPPSEMRDAEDEAGSTRGESGRSPGQKADVMPPKNSKPWKRREPYVEKALLVEDEAGMVRDAHLGSTKERASAVPPEKTKRQDGREPSVKKTLAREDVDDSSSDDVTCAICGSGDSQAPNEILLCDNCDLAAHQVCYGVQLIPEGDWLCRDCRPDEDEELMLVDSGTVSEPSLDLEASNIPDIEAFEYHMQVMQKLVLDKLTGQRRLKLYGLDEEYRKVHQVVEQTVLAGEGNSMLIIGARGCGKTALVESVMADLSKDHRENFHVVRLNGFIHTDDKLALREIWRQLGREMEVDDDLTSKTNNYADTLASLLALLSHPSEISKVETNQTAKSVIFILDEFDLFTSHPRQTLLYNLFDIAQARKAPIAVLGLTTKIDVVERLEKRVKSRFSHRYVHLPLPKNLAVYWEICRQGLLADMDELAKEGFTVGLDGQDEFWSFWESMINDLYNKDEVFKQQLQSQFYRSKSVSAFLTSCILPIANLTPNSIPLNGTSFFFTLPTLSPPDSKLHLLQSLAELDLALLIAAARLNIILDMDNCNFSMAYDEYSGLTSKHKIQTSSTGVAALGAATKVWGRDVAIGAWERLVDCELLVSAGMGGAGSAAGRDGGRENKMWRVDVALDEIPGSVEGLSGIMAKWCREI